MMMLDWLGFHWIENLCVLECWSVSGLGGLGGTVDAFGAQHFWTIISIIFLHQIWVDVNMGIVKNNNA